MSDDTPPDAVEPTDDEPGTGTDPDADGALPDLYPHIVDRADYDPAYDPDAPILCERCGGRMHYERQCKIVCHTCGYIRDCSDP
jgi:hypothetical protein